MNRTELRIGNYLQDRENRLCRVEEINIKEFKAPAIVGGITGLPNKPILLTEDWLLKFGFEKTDDADWTLDDFNLFSALTGSKVPHHLHYKDKMIWQSGGLYNKPFYVHDFQNLYFDLTGEELISKG